MTTRDTCVAEPIAKPYLEKAVRAAINLLFEKDAFLLRHNVSERAITHRLALHLTHFFPFHDVDCEYNSDIYAKKGRKYITFLLGQAIALGLISQQEKPDEDFIYRSVFPDIIVHKRGENGNNLLIIEVKKKKALSDVDKSFDFEKLKKYTSADDGNRWAYRYGLFLELPVDATFKKDKPELLWFQNGQACEA